MPLVFMGEDRAQVFRAEKVLPCVTCGEPTFLRLLFAPGRPVVVSCGRCRGW